MFQVIFSDEKKWNLDGPDGNAYYWRDLRKEERYLSRRNFGGGSVMVWAAFSSKGKLQLVFTSCKMKSEDYQRVLQDSLVPYLRRYRQTRFTFQQDNAAIHVSSSTREWFSERNIELMEWPACTPDGNPMENMWGIMVRRVYHENRTYGTKEELQAAILNAWNEIDTETIQRLVSSMPNRIFQLINRHGGLTDY
jgi:transposase